MGKPIVVQRPSRDPRKAKYGEMQPERTTRAVPVKIVSGSPWEVYLDPDHVEHWANPFYVGQADIYSVGYFESGAEADAEQSGS